MVIKKYLGVRNDKLREYGMRLATAFTFHAQNGQCNETFGCLNRTVIVTMFNKAARQGTGAR